MPTRRLQVVGGMLADDDALVSLADIMESNLISKAVGQQLMTDLPWRQRFVARLRSVGLLIIIAAVFWPTVWSVVTICTAYHMWGWSVASMWQKPSHQPTLQCSKTSSAETETHGQGAPGSGMSEATERSELCADAKFNGHPAEGNASPSADVDCTTGTAIVTGGKMTKALHVCRHLHAAGWRVVLLETHKYWHVGARLSTSVDAFTTVPVPELYPEEYTRAIADIAQREGASLFLPVSSPVASLYDAVTARALPQGCRSWTLSPTTTALLDNKARFSDFAASLDLLVPHHYVVTSAAQLRELNDGEVLNNTTFILKNLAYDSIHRAELFKLPCHARELAAYLSRPDIIISAKQPWILQEFIQGKEFSCYTLAHQGRVVAHADTAAELSNLNYKYEAHPGIRQWVESFVKRSGLNGQLCFDFIEAVADGRLYCIECNPRTSSVITEFHDNPAFAAALTNPCSIEQAVEPLAGSRPTYWWYNEITRLVTHPVNYWRAFLLVVMRGVDAVFDAADPLPFIGLHLLQVPALLLGNVWRGNPWTKVDLCIGKLAELCGD